MNINEQELSEAVDRLREGETVLGISCDDVYRQMLKDENLAMNIMETIHQWGSYVTFDVKFCNAVESMLREVLRTKQEIEAGMM